MIHDTGTHGILDLHFVQDLFATLDDNFFYMSGQLDGWTWAGGEQRRIC